MLTSKGHLQPHFNHLPRRRPRTHSSLDPLSHTNDPANQRLAGYRYPDSGSPGADNPSSSPTTTTSTRSGSLGGTDHSSSEHHDDGTPPTSPPGVIHPFDSFPRKIFSIPTSQPQTPPSGAESASTPASRLRLPHSSFHTNEVYYSSVSNSRVRGRLEPRAVNLPRRHGRAHKERERIDRRCLQELFRGSGVWIAFNPCFADDLDGDEPNEELTREEKEEWDWMWGRARGRFLGIVRVRVGQTRGERRRRKETWSVQGDQVAEEEQEELELTIGAEQARMYDAAGVSGLTPTQLEMAAKFLVDKRRRGEGKVQVLISVPPSRPVEALSIALLALSRPFSSLPDLSSSYLSQIRLLPGTLELQRAAQGIDVAVKSDNPNESNGGGVQITHVHQRYTLIQLALWHLHDLTPPPCYDEDDGCHEELKAEWRGALSFEGVAKLGNITDAYQ